MFKDFKPILLLLLRFLIIYVVFFYCYQSYLQPLEGIDLDPFSYWVADQVVAVQKFFGYATSLVPIPKYEAAIFRTEGKDVTKMVEGCNIISVLILYVAFIFAFYKGYKTIIYILFTVIALHCANVLRIAGLNIIYLEFPEYGKTAHDYLFPGVIYGLIVLLWLIWIKFFALKNENI